MRSLSCDVRGQVIALVRDHLKPGEFYKSGIGFAGLISTGTC